MCLYNQLGDRGNYIIQCAKLTNHCECLARACLTTRERERERERREGENDKIQFRVTRYCHSHYITLHTRYMYMHIDIQSPFQTQAPSNTNIPPPQTSL